MKKLKSYFVKKLHSSRLKREKFNLSLTFEEALKNGEIVRLSDCMLLRTIFRLKNRKIEIEKLESQVKKLQNKKVDKEKIINLKKQLYQQIYVPELCYVVFDNVSHYEKIIKNGLFINGKEYVRLLSSAGNARKKTVLFVEKDLIDDLIYVLDCGRDQSIKINPNKFNAYFSLCSSGGYEVDIPRIVIIPDKEVTRITPVDFVSENKNPQEDPYVEYREIDQTFNLFDGQGLMSRTFANQIAYDLELDYTPSAVVFRGAFTKGCLVTFDFHEFAEEQGVSKIIDVYGKEYDSKNVDVILSASQVKLWQAYSSMEHYLQECKKRNYKWTIVRPTPKEDKNTFLANYQYLQVLDLSEEKIHDLCEPTISYFNNISGLDWLSAVLFLMGEVEEKNISLDWFESLDSTLKQLLYKPESISDKYIQNKLRSMLEKRISDACEGKIILSGNYSVMISDPYAQAQHAFDLPITGLLKEREFYSQYWNKRNVNKIAGMRSPLTFRSEVNVMDLKNSEELDRWYFYLKSGTVYNVFDNSTMLHAGSD